MDTQKKRFSLFDTPLDPLTYQDTLEKIKKYLSNPPIFRHIVSINPENVILAQDNAEYRDVCNKSDLALTDGIGIIIASKILGKTIPERIPGSFLLPKLLDLAGAMSSRVLLIGSQANLAVNIAECYSRSYPEAKYIGIEGYKNKSKPTKDEEQAIEDIVRSTRPHFVFVSFGSPFQELWIYSHRALLKDSICMGVGGAFNYLSGVSPRPPHLITQLGFEWLYRLVSEPWRVQRQLSRLPRFAILVLKQWFSGV